MRVLFVILCCLTLAGCKLASVGDHENHAAPRIESPLPLAETVPEAEVENAHVAESLRELRTESQASNNAVQQSLTGLGANLGKVAEKVDASLVKIESRIDLSVSSSMQAHAELRSEIKTDLRANAEVHANAVTALRAEFLAKIEAVATAQVAAQAGIANKSEAITQTTSAGRDSTVTTQFTREMQSVLERSQSTVIVIVCLSAALAVICAGLISLAVERSRRRADARAKDLFGILMEEFREKPKREVGALVDRGSRGGAGATGLR